MILIGHRGAKHEAAENTLAGFLHLKNLGIQNVEFDIRLSADNQLVIIHDETLDRTTNAQGLVRDKSAAELKNLNVPTLQETLQVFDKLQHAQLEVKPPKAEDHQIICEGIFEAIETLGIRDKCIVTSFDYHFLKSCNKYIPSIARGFLCEESGAAKVDPIEIALKLNCCLLAIDYLLCDEQLIKRAHQANLAVSAWTVDDENSFKQLMTWGIDSIITNCPSKFIQLI